MRNTHGSSWNHVVAFTALGGQTIQPLNGSILDGTRFPNAGETRIAHIPHLPHMLSWGFRAPDYGSRYYKIRVQPKAHTPRGSKPRQYHGQFIEDCKMRAFMDVLGVGKSARSQSPWPIFIEMGALDGLRYSNSLAFEREGWRGILIEALGSNCEKLPMHRSSGQTINLCTAICTPPSGKPAGSLVFQMGGAATGHVVKSTEKKTYRPDGSLKYKRITVPCSPLGALLRQLRIPRIDYFSLDVEGQEYEVFRTWNWSIPFTVLQFEWRKPMGTRLQSMLEEHNYVCIGKNGLDMVCIEETNHRKLLRYVKRNKGNISAVSSIKLFDEVVLAKQQSDSSYLCPVHPGLIAPLSV
jgi:hypothetical protein